MLLLSCGFFFLFLAVFSFVVYPFTLRFFKHVPLAMPDGKVRSVTLLFCCHNEAKTIGSKLDNIRALKDAFSQLEVKIYLDACTDGTADIIRASKLDISLYGSDQHAGKNNGLNLMMQDVTTDLAAFTDANVMIDENAFSNAQRYFGDPEVGCVCSHLTYVNDTANTTAQTGGLQWKFEEWLKKAESVSGSTPAVDGSLFIIRTGLFETLPATAPNDFYSSLKILVSGHRVISAPDVKSFEKAAEKTKDELKRKIRISRRAMTCHLLLRRDLARMGRLNRYKYASHKLVRWFTAYWLLLAAGFMACGIWQLLGGMVLLGLVLTSMLAWGLATWKGVKPVPMLNETLVAFGATAYGVTTALMGARQSVWIIPQSSR